MNGLPEGWQVRIVKNGGFWSARIVDEERKVRYFIETCSTWSQVIAYLERINPETWRSMQLED